MSDSMEKLMESLYLDRVAVSWSKLAYPSLRPLGAWLSNLQGRIHQLQEWFANPADTPVCTWLPALFNPSSFLTAVMQTTAQMAGLELDKLVIRTEVLKKKLPEIEQHAREGAFIYGLFLEGAAWDGTCLMEARPKEL